jgi:hypothetical protein
MKECSMGHSPALHLQKLALMQAHVAMNVDHLAR